MLTQIWSARTDIVFVISGQVLLFLINITCTANVWFLRYEVEQTKLFCHLEQFFALLPFNSMKNQNTKNEKIALDIPRYHHFTQVYQKSWSSAMLFLRCGGRWMYLLFSFWAIFFPFSPPTPLPAQQFKKWKFQKQWKKSPRDIIILHKCTKKSLSYAILPPRNGTCQM